MFISTNKHCVVLGNRHCATHSPGATLTNSACDSCTAQSMPIVNAQHCLMVFLSPNGNCINILVSLLNYRSSTRFSFVSVAFTFATVIFACFRFDKCRFCILFTIACVAFTFFSFCKYHFHLFLLSQVCEKIVT